MQTQKKRTLKALSASALALGMIVTLDASAQATAGIAATRHNLGTSNRTASGNTTPSTNLRAGDLYTSGTAEICVFCHTPHANGTIQAPLWNKATQTTVNYTLYSSGTMQGAASLSNNMSLACLSCHDGTQAMDNILNMPSTGWNGTPGNHGSAGWDNTGTQRLSGTWYAGTAPSEGDATISGAMNAGIYMELGVDLSNDHPVGIPYCGGGQTTTGNASCADIDFNPVNTGPNASSYTVGTSATMKERMRLYSTGAQLTVECGSCHDPHNSTNTSFLRVSNAGSAVCLTCHTK